MMRGRVIKGHQVASGFAVDCPWPGGSVARQLPLMAQHGVPIDGLFAGTLNVGLEVGEVPFPDTAEFDFVLDWRAPDKPTHFRLHALTIEFGNARYPGWSYRKLYPPGYVSIHPQPNNVLEVLAPPIIGIAYGSRVGVRFASA
jgi:hypothetical protein